MQRARYGERLRCNAELRGDQILEASDPDPEALRLLALHVEASAASARVGRRLLKVARTLADLDGERRVGAHHVGRAVGLRSDASDTEAA